LNRIDPLSTNSTQTSTWKRAQLKDEYCFLT
jgi:hypothetical protein